MQAAATGESASVSTGLVKNEAGSAAFSKMEAAEGTLSLDAFDLDRVLSLGTPLLASGGQACRPSFKDVYHCATYFRVLSIKRKPRKVASDFKL